MKITRMNDRDGRIICFLSEKAKEIKQPVGKSRHACAIVDKKGRIVSYGTNSRKTHPLQHKFQNRRSRIYLHAEVAAIIKAGNRIGFDNLQSCSLYVIRVGAYGEFRSSKPCSGCQKAIDHYGFRSVIHS